MKTSELLPCPFCGSQAKTMQDAYGDHGHIIHIFRVYCFFSRCVVIERTNINKDIAESAAIKRWNTRVYPPDVQAAIERDTPKKLKRGDPILCEGDEFICQNCEGHVRKSLLKGNCCYNCGQRLDWSEE